MRRYDHTRHNQRGQLPTDAGWVGLRSVQAGAGDAMTRQELTERLRRSRGMSDYEHQADDREAVAALDALYAEIDALRSLPVIRTCEDCSHAYPSSEHWACGHPYSPGAGDEIVRIDAAPPTDCPLRSVLREG